VNGCLADGEEVCAKAAVAMKRERVRSAFMRVKVPL